MASDFSTLPLDLLGVIALKLETFEDFFKFSVVCRSWNSASSSAKHQWKAKPIVPWLLLAENNQNNPNCVRKIFNLSNNKCYKFSLPETFVGARCWGSSYGWIAMIDRNFDVQLFNPITKAQIPFPSLKPLYDGDEFDQNGESHQHWFLRGFADRLVVLKVPQNNNYEFVVLVVYEDYHSLVFARQGDQSWTPVFVNSKFRKFRMCDVVGMDDKDEDDADHDDDTDHDNADQDDTNYDDEDEDEDDADDVDHDNKGDSYYFCKTKDFKVYRFKSEDKSWEKIEDLGEVALVVGGNSSMCVSVTHANGLQRNCIYLTDDLDMCCLSVTKPGGHDTGVFNFKNGNIWQFYEGDDIHSSFSPPILFIPQF
ncbi:putative F-box protein At4g22170 [Silene latifolia]|uniref:putative F-box protein At4g22170 n=1 Tax=Silene latifolia TaxID=37657 RepID=UPI003D78A56E